MSAARRWRIIRFVASRWWMIRASAAASFRRSISPFTPIKRRPEIWSAKCRKRQRKQPRLDVADRSEEHTSELQSLMRISYAFFCLKKKIHHATTAYQHQQHAHTLDT